MSLKRNIVANYLGQGWASLIGFIFVPVYIKYLGIEAYGLIGIFTLLQAWLTVLDMGMTPTLNREMARLTAGAHTPQSIGNLLRSLEIVCLGIAIIISISVWAGSAWLASDWLRAEKIPLDVVEYAIAIMGSVAALRFVENIYRSAILGLQRQVFFNVLNACLATLRAGGAIGILVWVSPTIVAFFIWQGVMSIVSICVLAIFTHKSIPTPPSPARFSRQALMEIRHFAGGMMATTILAVLLTQVDKVILSKLISLESFGYYALAGTVVTSIGMVIEPVTQAIYPRFTSLVAGGESRELVHIFHRSAQLVTALVAPLTLMFIFFGRDFLALWTGNPTIANEVAPLLAVLAAGTFLNGLLHVPYMLQLAYGWSSFAAKVNLIAVVILIPAIFWATPRYGAVGAAWVWVILNVGYLLIGAHFLYKKLLPGEKWVWYWGDIARPMIVATLVAWFMKWVEPENMAKPQEIAWLIIVGLGILAAAIVITPNLRTLLIYNILPRQYKNS